ncbi:MAG: hypothetical protein IPJ90_08260 [Anaerolineaceae bacterium]|nr:hypothetical protein [Anaerolineaceae bacterium]
MLVELPESAQRAVSSPASASWVWTQGLEMAEAEAALSQNFSFATTGTNRLCRPRNANRIQQNPSELGLDDRRQPNGAGRLRFGPYWWLAQQAQEMFSSWYYGRSLSPVLVLDVSQLDGAFTELAADINKPPVSATYI